MTIGRTLRHLFAWPGAVARALPPSAMQQITEAIGASERTHTGEIRIACEATLPWSYLRKDLPARARALMVFSKLRVWDTEANNGVLIYLLLADHSIEIVADRGLNGRVTQDQWNAVRDAMVERLKAHDFAGGAVVGVEGVGGLLAQHYPSDGSRDNPDELTNAPAVL